MRAIQHLDYAPGLADTCDGCDEALPVGSEPICCIYERKLKRIAGGQLLRLAQCRKARGRNEGND